VSPLTSPPVLDALPVTLRLIQRAATGTVVLGATLAAQSPLGINGVRGYQSGNFEPPLSEQGTMTVTLPNAAGADGKLHRNRFDCLTDATYNQGDEWIEVWHGIAGRGRLLFVGTPTDWRISRSTITLTLVDGTGPLELQRETAAGFWNHAPRDVFEHYSKAWHTLIADDFAAGANATFWTTTGTTVAPGVKLTPAAINTTVSLVPVNAQWAGVSLPVTDRVWRAEMTYNRALLAADGVQFEMVSDVTSGTIRLGVGGALTTLALYDFAGVLYDSATVAQTRALTALGATVALECRDRWILAYVDGALAIALELDAAPAGTYRPRASITSGGTVGGTITIDSILLRRAAPYLMRSTDKGDYRLPGILPSGGLQGEYFDDSDLRTYGATLAYLRRALTPTRKPYARRQDPQINFASATPPVFQPVGSASGTYFSARWTGAIYLDLATTDIFLQITAHQWNARVWIGKTMYGEAAMDHWNVTTGAAFTTTSPSMRTHLGTSVAGWYPIRIEWVQLTGAGGLVLQQSTTGSGGAYSTVPAASLSPYGIYKAELRYDSHAEQLKAVAGTFGYQYRCEPRALETVLFPGELVPRIRVGRDTDKILSPSESTDVELAGSAQDTIQTLLADAAGLADPNNAAQLTGESVDFTAVFPAAIADRHMMTTTAYESLADITDPGLLATRLAAMLGLRLAPWEEIGARPRGGRELRDTFPLTGSLALFAWEPGDGIRIVDDQLGFADTAPRQIIAPSWPFGPDGLGAPSIRFRQRPRSQQDALRDLVRAVLLPQRNYQGQLVIVTGTHASNPATALEDTVSIASLPLNIADLVRCELVIQVKTDASAGTLAINGTTTGLTANTTGRYDLTAFAARSAPTFPRVYAQVTGHTGVAEYALELLVRV
jgi:hypothetical protein